ncbi:MAG: hypothetical protein KatS3mg022_0857 [Armatimonadota bacterium]|nr:MAG: hypothetical protein KatS3mg022_0857 [Armatimonadota bacterium]
MEEIPSAWGIKGVLVNEVIAGSPAEEAVILSGDIILQVDDAPVDSIKALQQTVRRMSPGQACTVHLQRGRSLLQKMEKVRTLAEAIDLAVREKQTLAQVLEAVRDGIGLLADFTPLKEHPATLAWKYGSNVVDLVHSFFTYHETWYGITQLERTNDQYLYRVYRLADELKVLMERAKVLRERIASAE